MEVVVVGACNTDLTSYVTKLPGPGETIHGHDFKTGFGGKGANQCVMAAKLGATTAMIGKVGNDDYGRATIGNFEDNNIDTSCLGVVDGKPTGVAPIAVDENGQNSIIIVNGANDDISPEDIDCAEGIISSAKVLICQNEIPRSATLAAILAAQKHNVASIFNLAPAVKDIEEDLFSVPDIFCVNESEASIVTGISVKDLQGAEQAANYLREEKKANIIIITLGEQGSYVLPLGDAKPFLVPCEKVVAVDASGAGDSFIGALGYLLAKVPDMPLKQQVEKAGRIATMSVLKLGTQSSYPSREEALDHLS
eukprot:m.15450 g.15450  ORF g.15450 m.15450 type:complete len:309 (+) comp4480_c0_seq1:58-984(+)